MSNRGEICPTALRCRQNVFVHHLWLFGFNMSITHMSVSKPFQAVFLLNLRKPRGTANYKTFFSGVFFYQTLIRQTDTLSVCCVELLNHTRQHYTQINLMWSAIFNAAENEHKETCFRIKKKRKIITFHFFLIDFAWSNFLLIWGTGRELLITAAVSTSLLPTIMASSNY